MIKDSNFMESRLEDQIVPCRYRWCLQYLQEMPRLTSRYFQLN